MRPAPWAPTARQSLVPSNLLVRTAPSAACGTPARADSRSFATEPPARRAPPVLRAHKERWGRPERPAPLAQQERPAPLARLGHKVLSGRRVPLEPPSPGRPKQQAPTACMAAFATPAPAASPSSVTEPRVRQGQRGPPAQLAPLALRALKVRRARSVRRGPRVQQASPLPGRVRLRAPTVSSAARGSPPSAARRSCATALQARREPLARRARKVPRGRSARRVRLALRARLVPREQPARRGQLVRIRSSVAPSSRTATSR